MCLSCGEQRWLLGTSKTKEEGVRCTLLEKNSGTITAQAKHVFTAIIPEQAIFYPQNFFLVNTNALSKMWSLCAMTTKSSSLEHSPTPFYTLIYGFCRYIDPA
jgi:hypothetical protein